MTIAQYGNTIQFTNDATPEQRAEIVKHFEAANKDTLKELEIKVLDLQRLISQYSPLELIHRANYELLLILIKNKTESEYSGEETLSLPSAEYLQYLIARTKFETKPREINDNEWRAIWAELFDVLKLTQTYLITRPIPSDFSKIDELRFFIDTRRLVSRIRRYANYLEDHLRTSLGPYDEWIKSAYGITADQLVQGLLQIHNFQKAGVLNRQLAFFEEHSLLMRELEDAGYLVGREATNDEIEKVRVALRSDEFRSRFEDVQNTARNALTIAAFDITDVSSLPAKVMSLLSVRPGEDVLTVLTGPDHDDLSPLSTSVLHQKPFLEVDGQFYLTYHSGLEDRVADIVEADLLQIYPASKQTILDRRSAKAEDLGDELLRSVLKPDKAYQNLYYPNPDIPGDLTELDSLLIVDDVLVLGEVKGGSLSAGAQRGAPKEIASELSDLIIKGQHQSERAEKYMKSADEVHFFEETGKRVVVTLRHSEFRKIFRIIITREDLGWVGARIAILSILDPSLSNSYPWHVSIDDLRVVAELFGENELQFIHFLEQRLTAAAQTNLSQHDELDHVALYQKVPHYPMMPTGPDHIVFDGSFLREIDVYFREKLVGKVMPLPRQPMPEAMRSFIDQLKASKLLWRAEIASFLLSLGEAGRRDIEHALNTLIEAASRGRRPSVRMPFTNRSIGLTITFARNDEWEDELKLSATQMEGGYCSRWLVVQLQPRPVMKVLRIERLERGRFSDNELELARTYLEKRVSERIRNRKPSRNDQCPCGSGKKYKKCHGA